MTLQAIIYPTEFQNLGTDWNWDGETITKATGYVYQVESSSFLVCFKILIEILSQLRGLTLKLQMQAADIINAYGEVGNIIELLVRMREESEQVFKTIFSETMLGKELYGTDFELKKPRISGRQVHHSNIEATSTEDYYRITYFNEFLSHVTLE